MLEGKIFSNSISTVSRSKFLLEIIHTDLCGPMRTQSLRGSKYFMTFTDDFSRWCQISFLKYKSDALEAFKNFKSIVKNDNELNIVRNCLMNFLLIVGFNVDSPYLIPHSKMAYLRRKIGPSLKQRDA